MLVLTGTLIHSPTLHTLTHAAIGDSHQRAKHTTPLPTCAFHVHCDRSSTTSWEVYGRPQLTHPRWRALAAASASACWSSGQRSRNSRSQSSILTRRAAPRARLGRHVQSVCLIYSHKTRVLLAFVRRSAFVRSPRLSQNSVFFPRNRSAIKRCLLAPPWPRFPLLLSTRNFACQWKDELKDACFDFGEGFWCSTVQRCRSFASQPS